MAACTTVQSISIVINLTGHGQVDVIDDFQWESSCKNKNTAWKAFGSHIYVRIERSNTAVVYINQFSSHKLGSDVNTLYASTPNKIFQYLKKE